MANCNTIKSITAGCDFNSGGIYEVYIADQLDVTATTVNVSAHTITTIGLSGSAKFATFQFKRNVGSLVVEPAVDLINGTTIYNTTLTLQFNRREAAKSAQLMILGSGQRYLDIIVKDALGQYSFVDFAQFNGGNEETGVKKEDGSKYTLTFLAQLDTRPYFVDPTIISGITAIVS